MWEDEASRSRSAAQPFHTSLGLYRQSSEKGKEAPGLGDPHAGALGPQGTQPLKKRLGGFRGLPDGCLSFDALSWSLAPGGFLASSSEAEPHSHRRGVTGSVLSRLFTVPQSDSDTAETLGQIFDPFHSTTCLSVK